jgi:predicted flap endonuclease-1-like 5' DNA nuclease
MARQKTEEQLLKSIKNHKIYKTMCICVLIPILVGLICALLGYLLGQWLFKNSSQYKQLLADLQACRERSADLMLQFEKLDKEHSDLKMSFAALTLPVFDAELAARVFGTKVVQDDLKIVEGIGPKIEELFHGAGVRTWKALSELPVEKCREILDSGGERYRIHNPATWPKQCELAYLGKWQELKVWQDELTAGKV